MQGKRRLLVFFFFSSVGTKSNSEAKEKNKERKGNKKDIRSNIPPNF